MCFLFVVSIVREVSLPALVLAASIAIERRETTPDADAVIFVFREDAEPLLVVVIQLRRRKDAIIKVKTFIRRAASSERHTDRIYLHFDTVSLCDKKRS